eukprot:TRINITY_DN4064_c0_g2_i3.p1 TRINITY_DN4064_c0_g2~~TRINITY_DN4064_c0_g2_i3.p1  ORF type:complete len:213 (-),score=63.01 TRINITY_DN4064_c0_g2_i3:82-720(-)
MEAIEEQIKLFPRNQVVVNIVKKNIGAISDGDVKIATTTTKNKCLIIGFNVPVLDMAKVAASSLGVRIHVFTVIYSLLDFLMEYCSSLLPPDVKYVEIAHAKVKKRFVISKSGEKVPIAGCEVTKGTVKRGGDVQLKRNGEVIWTGKIRQLQHHKDSVKLVEVGKDCGIMFSGDYTDFLEGDDVVMVRPEFVKQTFTLPEYQSFTVKDLTKE